MSVCLLACDAQRRGVCSSFLHSVLPFSLQCRHTLTYTSTSTHIHTHIHTHTHMSYYLECRVPCQCLHTPFFRRNKEEEIDHGPEEQGEECADAEGEGSGEQWLYVMCT